MMKEQGKWNPKTWGGGGRRNDKLEGEKWGSLGLLGSKTKEFATKECGRMNDRCKTRGILNQGKGRRRIRTAIDVGK